MDLAKKGWWWWGRGEYKDKRSSLVNCLPWWFSGTTHVQGTWKKICNTPLHLYCQTGRPLILLLYRYPWESRTWMCLITECRWDKSPEVSSCEFLHEKSNFPLLCDCYSYLVCKHQLEKINKWKLLSTVMNGHKACCTFRVRETLSKGRACKCKSWVLLKNA